MATKCTKRSKLYGRKISRSFKHSTVATGGRRTINEGPTKYLYEMNSIVY